MHYYQQPGDKITEDPTRTSLGGHYEQLKFGKYGGGFTRFESSLLRQSAGFEVNDPQYESELITSAPARVESCW